MRRGVKEACNERVAGSLDLVSTRALCRGPMAIASVVVLIVLAIAVAHAILASRAASVARDNAGEVVAIDAAVEQWPELQQVTIKAPRYGICGRPDRVLRRSNGDLVPVEVKNASCPRTGPHERHLAQLGVYCLLVEQEYGCSVKEGLMEFRDRTVTIQFDDELRAWVLSVIAEVQAVKRNTAAPGRSHNQRTRCAACGFREQCQERLT